VNFRKKKVVRFEDTVRSLYINRMWPVNHSYNWPAKLLKIILPKKKEAINFIKKLLNGTFLGKKREKTFEKSGN